MCPRGINSHRQRSSDHRGDDIERGSQGLAQEPSNDETGSPVVKPLNAGAHPSDEEDDENINDEKDYESQREKKQAKAIVLPTFTLQNDALRSS